MTRCRSAFLTLFLCLMMGQGHASDNVSNAYRTFWYPAYQGQALDYCAFGGGGCGACIADQYCQRMGYAKAQNYSVRYNVGLTHYYGTRKACKGWNCHGFREIRCVGNILHQPTAEYYYRTHVFPFPRYDNYRVDWCYLPGKDCGQRAANSFCKRMGYARTTRYAPQGRVMATRALGNHRLCFGPLCKGFEQITCYR